MEKYRHYQVYRPKFDRFGYITVAMRCEKDSSVWRCGVSFCSPKDQPRFSKKNGRNRALARLNQWHEDTTGFHFEIVDYNDRDVNFDDQLKRCLLRSITNKPGWLRRTKADELW